MEKYEYDNFRNWLIQTNRIEDFPDAINRVFALNRLLERNICDDNLFDIIRHEDYEALKSLRNNYFYKRDRNLQLQRDEIIELAFDYLGKNYWSFAEYEGLSVDIEDRNKIWRSDILYLHGGHIRCLRMKHQLTDVAAVIITGRNKSIKVHANYCANCHINFMRKEEYERLRKQYSFLVANFEELDAKGYLQNSGKNRQESVLKLCGYSVKNGKNELSDRQREDILVNIMHNGILSKAEIIEYLEFFLQFNAQKPRMENAQKKWNRDLAFVRAWKIDDHPVLKVTEIKPYL